MFADALVYASSLTFVMPYLEIAFMYKIFLSTTRLRSYIQFVIPFVINKPCWYIYLRVYNFSFIFFFTLHLIDCSQARFTVKLKDLIGFVKWLVKESIASTKFQRHPSLKFKSLLNFEIWGMIFSAYLEGQLVLLCLQPMTITELVCLVVWWHINFSLEFARFLFGRIWTIEMTTKEKQYALPPANSWYYGHCHSIDNQCSFPMFFSSLPNPLRTVYDDQKRNPIYFFKNNICL